MRLKFWLYVLMFFGLSGLSWHTTGPILTVHSALHSASARVYPLLSSIIALRLILLCLQATYRCYLNQREQRFQAHLRATLLIGNWKSCHIPKRLSQKYWWGKILSTLSKTHFEPQKLRLEIQQHWPAYTRHCDWILATWHLLQKTPQEARPLLEPWLLRNPEWPIATLLGMWLYEQEENASAIFKLPLESLTQFPGFEWKHHKTWLALQAAKAIRQTHTAHELASLMKHLPKVCLEVHTVTLAYTEHLCAFGQIKTAKQCLEKQLQHRPHRTLWYAYSQLPLDNPKPLLQFLEAISVTEDTRSDWHCAMAELAKRLSLEGIFQQHLLQAKQHGTNFWIETLQAQAKAQQKQYMEATMLYQNLLNQIAVTD